VFSYLQNKNAVSELFREISPKISDRPGGYTRILKTGTRLGDSADMCIIELVDYNENLLAAKMRQKENQHAAEDVVAASPKLKLQLQPEAAVEDAAEVTEEVTEEKVESTEANAGEVAADESKEDVKEEPKAEAKAEEKKEEDKSEGDAKEESK
jgi:large subunit ribosomal protein L17